MCLLMILLMSSCFLEIEGKTKGKRPHHVHKHKHHQWLKHPLYIPAGKHYIDESIQPGKHNSMKQLLGMGHKTINRPKPFVRYGTRPVGFKQIPVYNTKTGQVGFANIPIYSTKTGQAGFKVPMYNTKTRHAGLKKIPLYSAKTGQSELKKIPMYNTKIKKIPKYNSKTGQTSFAHIPKYGTNSRQWNIPMYGQTGLNQLAMYQMMSGKSSTHQLPSIPAVVPYNTPFVMAPMVNTPRQVQPLYINPPIAAIQGGVPLSAANQMNFMYPTGLSGVTGLSGFENSIGNQGLTLPGFTGLPMLQAGDALAQSISGQANAQAKSIVSAPKQESTPSFMISVDGMVGSIMKQGDSAINFDSGDASISLAKKNKVSKLSKKEKPSGFPGGVKGQNS